MANERLPNERYPDGMNRPDMSTRPGVSGAGASGAGMTGAGLTEPGLTGTEYERAARMDSRLQPDPELTEGRASGGRIAAYAVGIAILLGAVFYGLNNMSMHNNNEASTTPTSQTASKQPAPNSSPGVTTGAAGDRTAPPPAPAGNTNTHTNAK